MLLPFALLLLATGALSETKGWYTNLECKMLDPSYGEFLRCDLKMIRRGVVGLNVYAKLKKPFNNAKVNLSLWRRFNGYRPFMFNTTFDFCKFMANSNNPLSFHKLHVDAVASASNINHSCPYNHDIIVRDMVNLEDYFKYLPLPTGDYKTKLLGGTNNEWKVLIITFFSRKEDLMKS